MKKLVLTWVTAIVLLGWAGIAQTKQLMIEPTPDEAFVKLSTISNELSLGTASFIGINEFKSGFLLKVESNCLHGSILASTEGFRRDEGGFIPAKHISIRSPVTNGFVPMEEPVVISNEVFGSHDIALDFGVQTGPQHHQGRYTGLLIFTILPPSAPPSMLRLR